MNDCPINSAVRYGIQEDYGERNYQIMTLNPDYTFSFDEQNDMWHRDFGEYQESFKYKGEWSYDNNNKSLSFKINTILRNGNELAKDRSDSLFPSYTWVSPDFDFNDSDSGIAFYVGSWNWNTLEGLEMAQKQPKLK